MKVYEGLNEKTKDIIVDVLEKYCVPKRVEVIKKETFFGDYKTYNIHLDLKEEPLKFIKEKIQERLNLEKSFNLKAVNPDTLKDIPQNYTESKKVDTTGSIHRFLGNKNLVESLLDLFRKPSKEEIQEEQEAYEAFTKFIQSGALDFGDSKQAYKQLDTFLQTFMGIGKEVTFDDLDYKDQQNLLKEFSIELLRSKACKIIKSSNGIVVEIKEM